MANNKRQSIEEVKADAERVTRQRIAADKENNPELWEALGLAEPDSVPAESKKEGK